LLRLGVLCCQPRVTATPGPAGKLCRGYNTGIQWNCLAAYRRSSCAKAKARVDASFGTMRFHFAVTYPSVVVSCARAETTVKKAA
jgi:hypothetical protein